MPAPAARTSPAIRAGEEITGFAIRQIKFEVWWQAHDEICPEATSCTTHTCPHDEGTPQ